MKTLFNEIPNISYCVNYSDHAKTLRDGYAATIEDKEKATVLFFQNVDDHTDGNGLCVLWIVQGEGRFYYNGDALYLQKGDVVLFDDNLDHGFESEKFCIGVNFTITPNYSLEQIQQLVQNFNTVKPKKRM